MQPTLKNPHTLKPSDVEAHAVLDDDGNPWHPLDPAPATPWQVLLRDKLDEATAALQTRPMLGIAIAVAAGYLIGRVLTARSS